MAASLRQQGQYAEWPALAGLLEDKLRSFSADSPIDDLRRQVSEACLSASARLTGMDWSPFLRQTVSPDFSRCLPESGKAGRKEECRPDFRV
jgi:hypothetical protein